MISFDQVNHLTVLRYHKLIVNVLTLSFRFVFVFKW